MHDEGVGLSKNYFEAHIWEEGKQVPALLYQYLTLVYDNDICDNGASAWAKSQGQYLPLSTSSSFRCHLDKDRTYM